MPTETSIETPVDASPINASLEQRLKKILAIAEKNDVQRAISQLNALLTHFPEEPRALHNLGLLYKKQQKKAQAIEAFEQVLAIAPHHIPTLLQLALTYKATGRTALAEKKLKVILTHRPQHFPALMNLAALLRDRQAFDAALIYYDRAAQAFPGRIAPPLQAAKTLSLLGRFDQAEVQFTRLLETHADSYQLYMEFGYHSRRAGDRQQAAHYFEQAQPLAQQSTQCLNASVQAAMDFSELGQLDRAEQLLTSAITESPEHLLALQQLGRLHMKRHQLDQAIDCYQKALSINPQHLGAHIQLSAVRRQKGDYSEAQQQLERALSAHPDHLNVLLELASLACLQQDYSRALTYCEQAHQAHPDHIQPLLKRADVFYRTHDFAAAEKQLLDLRRTHPSDAQVVLKLAQIEHQRGQHQKSLKYLQQAQKLDVQPTQKLNAQLRTIEQLKSLGRLEDALAAARALIKAQPENARAKAAIAAVLQQQQLFDEAETLYRELAQALPHETFPQIELARILSETYRLPEAIRLLESLYDAGHRELRLLMLLGQFSRAQDDWDRAFYWYSLAKDLYPTTPQVYSVLADIQYMKGAVDSAVAILEAAQVQLPNAPEIPLRLADIKLRFGYADDSIEILEKARSRFEDYLPFALNLCKLRLREGAFDQVEKILSTIKCDRSSSLKQVSQMRGEMALYQLQLATAIKHFRHAIEIAPATTHEHQMLATALMLTGEVEQAHKQLVKATENLNIRRPPAEMGRPITGHVALLVNQLRNNPPLLAQIKRSQSEETGEDRLLTLGSILIEEPAYLGGAEFLAKELQQQGIFTALHNSFQAARLPASRQIPKRIVQYWDDALPPAEVVEVGSSWALKNPDYEYQRFSFDQAIEFIEQHYEADVLQAFYNCEHPATQSDLFRLAYLNQMGGFYADADDRARRALDDLVASNAELVVYQEDNACIGNNFIGCVPGQPMIRSAFYQAVENLLCYNNEGPWLQTGPGLVTTSICSGLVPYLSQTDYRSWPRLWVLGQHTLWRYVWPSVSLPYKKTLKSWQKAVYDDHK